MDYDRLRELQEKFDENPRRYFAPLANEYRKGGQAKRAIEICRTHLAQMPGHMSGQIVFGQALFETGEYEEARQVFERAIVLDPENLIALRSLGDMSLQAGNTAEAREWYTRLLDADPKDTTVIALVSEIDASADATPVEPFPAIPGIDTDVGDQQIPFIQDTQNDATAAAARAHQSETPAAPATKTEWSGPQSSTSAAPAQASGAGDVAPPMPSEMATAREQAAPPMPSELASMGNEPTPPMPSEMSSQREESSSESSAAVGGEASEPPVGLERHYPEPEQLSQEEIETLGVTSDRTPLVSRRVEVNEPLVSRRDESDNPLDNWDVPETVAPDESEAVEAPALREDETVSAGPTEQAQEPVAAETPNTSAEPSFTGASSEPFVNETMAQLYLKQGYRELALQVYHRLAEARPNDQALRDRIAEIEATEPAPPVQARRDDAPVERPAEPAPSRSPIESPRPSEQESEETPSFDRSPVDSPPTSPRRRESIESPMRDEPRAEPEGVAARQPSVREFFATLGRRKPPRDASGGRSSYGATAPQGSSPLADVSAPLGASASTASLDAVFAGAEVSASDSRAASRLAGAFSGTPRSTTPQTPPVPTPRINPRLQTQESEEDVAKFRAWLDGLTGE